MLRTAAVMLSMTRENKTDSIDRVERALVEDIEAEVLLAKADAEYRASEAAEIQARASLKHAQADLTKAKADAARIEARARADTMRRKSVAEAMARLADAALKLKRAGGSVVIVESEMSALLREGQNGFPSDSLTVGPEDTITNCRRENG